VTTETRWRSRGALVRGLWLPIGAWLIATATVFSAVAFTGRMPFSSAPWMHWDAFEYLDISEHGYNLFPCFVGNLLRWCGNAGWFPAYPWLVRAIASPGLDHTTVAIALAWLFDLAAIVLLWAGFYRRIDFGAVAAVIFAAFAPGLVYDYAGFPLSMLAFLTLLYLWLLSGERWLVAGLVGIAAVLTYPVGVAAPLAAASALLIAYRRVPGRERFRRACLASGPPLLALTVIPIVQQRSTGHWNAYYLAQYNFGHWLEDPFAGTIAAFHLLGRGTLFTLANVPSAQALLATGAVLGVAVAVLARGRRTTSFEVLLVIWMLAAWAIPEATSGTSHYRGEAALLPMAILIGVVPRVLAVALCVTAIAVSVPIEVLFLRNTLI
jgi:hypothetical protein